MIVRYVNLNIFSSLHLYDVFVHGCNCFCTMGAGVASVVNRYFNEAYQEDLKTLRGDKSKLGTYTMVNTKLPRELDDLYDTNITVVNAYTQYGYGTNKTHVVYDAIRKVFTTLNKDFSGKRFCIPKIGAGLAGGDWNTIESIINNVTPDIEIVVYYI